MKRISFTTRKGTIISCLSDVIGALYFKQDKYYVRVYDNNKASDYEIDLSTYKSLFKTKEIEGLLSW